MCIDSRLPWLVVAFLGLGACDRHTTPAQDSRPTAEACTAAAPGPGTCAAPSTATLPTFECTSDANCNAGVNGRCMNNGGGPAGCYCQYDACTEDSSCQAGQVCICRGSADWSGGNTCLTGNCQVNADCASGYCSLSESNVIGFFCHTAKDTCYSDADCPSDPNCLGTNQCEFTTDSGYWQCLCHPIPV